MDYTIALRALWRLHLAMWIVQCCYCGELHTAIENNDIAAVNRLVGHEGIDLEQRDSWGRTALHIAASEGHIDLLNLLIAAKAKVNAADNGKKTPLHSAAKMNRTECARVLIEHGAEIDAKGNEGNTPLLVAVKSGSLECAKLLLTNKANVRVQSNAGETALHIAARFGWLAIIEELVSHGASVNDVDEMGRPPIFEALASKSLFGATVQQRVSEDELRLKMVRLFLANRANPNWYEADGESLLHIAVELENIEIIRALLNHGARVNVKSQAGSTPLDKAKDDEIKNILRAALAEELRNERRDGDDF